MILGGSNERWRLMSRYLLLIILSSISFSNPVKALIIGSNSHPGDTFVTFPAADSDNEVASDAMMRNGFALADNTTTCTFNSFFPVAGNVQLHGGTLWVTQDLIFHNPTTFTNLGDIKADDMHELSLASGMSIFGEGANEPFTFENICIILHSDVAFKSPIQFEGTCVIEGAGHLLDLSSTASLIVGSDSTLTLRNIHIKGISGDNIQCVDDTGTIILEDLLWTQDANYYHFDRGAFQFKNRVTIKGRDGIFAYQSREQSLIERAATLKFDKSFTFSYDPDSNSKNLISFEDNSSTLVLSSASLHTASTGMHLTKGNMRVKGNVTIKTELGLAKEMRIGSSAQVNDFRVTIAGGSTMILSEGTIIYNNFSPDLLVMENNASLLRITKDTSLIIDESLHLAKGGIEFGKNSELIVRPGKELTGSIFPLGTIKRMPTK